MIRLLPNRAGLLWALVYVVPVGLALAGGAAGTRGDDPSGPISGALAQIAGPRGDAAPTVVATKPLVTGDAFLRGQIDLDKATLVDDRYYEVPLPHGGKAILTLDPKIQESAEKVVKRAKSPYASVVVMGLDGRILALAGASQKDPTLTATQLATRPWAPSASIFKIVTGAALVDAGVPGDTKVCYHGGLRSVNSSNLEDDPKRDRVCNTLSYAVAKSQNAIIAKLAHKNLKPDGLRKYAELFGYSTAFDFALDYTPHKADLPDDPLDFAKAAAGFGNTELSTVGGAVMTQVVATRGMTTTPWIVAEVVDAGGQKKAIHAPKPRRVIAPDTAEAVAEMMVGTCERGTAYVAFHDRSVKFLRDIKVAGKTGSLGKDGISYSWFVGFAPADEPKAIVSVALGNTDLWYIKAHTGARIVLESVFAE